MKKEYAVAFLCEVFRVSSVRHIHIAQGYPFERIEDKEEPHIHISCGMLDREHKPGAGWHHLKADQERNPSQHRDPLRDPSSYPDSFTLFFFCLICESTKSSLWREEPIELLFGKKKIEEKKSERKTKKNSAERKEPNVQWNTSIADSQSKKEGSVVFVESIKKRFQRVGVSS
jgi:hypothetical protein